jgi:hypothetical protein
MKSLRIVAAISSSPAIVDRGDTVATKRLL